MIGREKRVLLRHYLEQGMSKAAIARDLGISRRTVYRWIKTGQLDRELDDERVGYGPRRAMSSKLDPYKPLIDARLNEYPKLTAVRLFKEVRAAGYPGSYNQVKRYVRRFDPDPQRSRWCASRPRPGVRARWTSLTLGQALRTNRRAGLLEAAVGSVLRAADHEGPVHGQSSFSYFGGVPSELLFDQMKAVVITVDTMMAPSSRTRSCATHTTGTSGSACRPYRAQTKGKVERPIRYLRGASSTGAVGRRSQRSGPSLA